MAPTGDEPESETYSVISSNGPPYIQDRRLYFPLDEANCVFPFQCCKNSSIDLHCAPAPSQLVNTLSSLLVPYSSSSDPEHRVVQYSPHYRLAFSLLNEDAAAGGAVMDWNILSSINCMCKAFSSI
jgi:phosphatidylinositol glycan class S